MELFTKIAEDKISDKAFVDKQFVKMENRLKDENYKREISRDAIDISKGFYTLSVTGRN